MNWRKVLAFGLVIALIATLGLACAKKGPKAAAEQVLRYNLGTEPETLDPAKMTGIPEFTALMQFMEGLTRIGTNGNPEPGIAKSWEISPDGTKYTFHLRDAVWTSGEPVTAYDFEFAWKRALDPATAADYAYQLYYIKGGQAFNEGKGTADEVGVKAKDAKTLEVTLEAPTPYFLSLTAFQTYMPLPKSLVESNPDWWTKPETMACNGPFKVTVWDHHSKLEYAKNDKYWDAKSVKLSKLIYYMIEESSTELTMFETGEIDFADNPPLPDIDRLKAEGKLKISTLLGTYYYLFQCQKVPINDARVRKALTYAIDRQSLVTNVTKGGQVPATAFVPPQVPDAKPGKDFRTVGGEYFKDNDVATAQKLLAEAGYPGGANFPPVEILYNTSEAHKAIAEAIQEMWKKSLGITGVTLTNQEWGVYLATRDQGTYQIARAGWLGDYLDPMTFLDMWVTGGGNNNTFWGDAEYDRLVEEAKKTLNNEERFAKMHKIEDILFRDNPIAPIYYYVDLWLCKDYVQGIYKSPLGPTDFKWAWIAEH
ncbi:MAG: peptide ABC transporter substrate-binding protein [Acetobacteraceae bacterium]|nr:peptide ABC transporter substrate-binding protein [Acetobacteraceae bacterium]